MMDITKLSMLNVLKIYNHELDFAKIKLVRHMDTKNSHFKNIISEQNLVEEYQTIQTKEIFKDCTHIISFKADGSTRAIFFGLYKVNGIIKKGYFSELVSNELSQYEDATTDSLHFKYDLERVTLFDELMNRLVIDWGGSTLSWHQWASKDKRVIEILPQGFVQEFPGYLEVDLTFNELSKIVDDKNMEANKIWIEKLKDIYAVYLIRDNLDGTQYIGSAYGEADGLFGRWSTYAKTHVYENKRIRELIDLKGIGYEKNFSFTILHVMPKYTRKEEVIKIESMYKRKLGTRVFGLNDN